MPALYSLITPYPGLVGGVAFAVVADDTQAHYVFPPGIDESGDLDDARIADVIQALSLPTASAADWLNAATYNLGYYSVNGPVEAPDIDAATKSATAEVAEWQEPATLDEETGNDPWAPPVTREDRVAFQRQMSDEWAQLYPAAADGGVDDPEADLALTQMMTPPVDPTKPHKWLPIATTETDCGFCDQPADANIHNSDADTITSSQV